VSHLADRFVKDPNQVVAVQQKVKVTVMEVDVQRKRIALSLKSDPFNASPKKEGSHQSMKSEGLTKPKPKEPVREVSMEEKMAALMNKFKK
jgi:uncharacterized protein